MSDTQNMQPAPVNTPADTQANTQATQTAQPDTKANEIISQSYVKFRMPYGAIDVYLDPKTKQPYDSDTLDDAARENMTRSQKLSQARYDEWLACLQAGLSALVPSLTPCDERPSTSEHVVLKGPLFTVSTMTGTWYFSIRLATIPCAGPPAATAQEFQAACRALRDVLLKNDAASSVFLKRGQAHITPLASVSDADLNDIAMAAMARLDVPLPEDGDQFLLDDQDDDYCAP